MAEYLKDPEAKLDYAVDWSAWLQDGETITTSDWTVTGVTKSVSPAATVVGGKAIVWLEGGTVGTPASAKNTVTTSAGRTDERTITLQLVNR